LPVIYDDEHNISNDRDGENNNADVSNIDENIIYDIKNSA
jgi:hypothetical protein